MRLLVTRPRPDASKTARRLRALGHEPIIEPLLEIIFTRPPDDLPEPGAIVLTSRNAVRAYALWPQSREWRSHPAFVTGPGTMQSAREAGLTDIQAADGDSASLATLILSKFGRSAGPILYPAPRDRSGALAEQLSREGYDVHMIEAYRAEPVTRLDPAIVAGLRSGKIEGVLLYSLRTAKTFRALAETYGISEHRPNMTFFALSRGIADALSGSATDVRVARTPDEAGLFDLLPPGR